MSETKYLTGLPLLLATTAIALATFLIVLDYSIANVSIPYIAGDLAVSVDQGTYVITAFAVGNAIVLPISGWLTKRVGTIRLMFLSTLGFTFLSFICGMSENIETLVTARFLQGAAAGPMIPLSQTLIVLIFPPEKKSAALSFWSTVVIVAPILGPIVGGWLSYDYSWPWIFFINIPVGIFSALTVKLLLGKQETPIEKHRTDWVGLVLLAVSVSCFQFLLDKGEQYDWLKSDLIASCAVISFVCFVFLIAWELLIEDPLLELRLLKIHSYMLSIVYIGVMYALYFGTVVLVPLWLQTNMGYTAIWAGIAVAPIGIIPALFSFSMGKVVDRIGPLIPLFLALSLFSLSSFETAYLNTDVDIWNIMFSRFLLGFGMLFFIVPLFELQVRDLPKENMASGAGMFHFVRAMSGGIGTSIFTTLWTRRSAFHHANLASQVVPERQPVDAFFSRLNHMGFTEGESWELLNDMTNNQAAVLGLNDCFYIIGWTFLALIPLLILGREKKKRALNEV